MLLKSLLNKSIFELKKAGIPSPELDTKVLLEYAMKKGAIFVYSHPEYLITNSQYSRFRRYIRRRKRGEPIAYITGHKEFFGIDFIMNKHVLIPRPESEWLVKKNIVFLKNYESKIMNQKKSSNHVALNVLDIGCGSGCIVIALYINIHNFKYIIHNSAFFAADTSKKGLLIAKKNAKRLNTKNIKFYQSDLFSNRNIKNKIFDLIMANLPYVPYQANHKSQITNNGISFEPQEAIFAKDNGMAVIKRFLKEAKNHIKPGGLILLELDPRNAKQLYEFAQKYYPAAKIKLQKDLAGLNRYLEIKN